MSFTTLPIATQPLETVSSARIDSKIDIASAQAILGIKTFANSPLVPTPTTNFQAATKKYVDDNNPSARVDKTLAFDYSGSLGTLISTVAGLGNPTSHVTISAPVTETVDRSLPDNIFLKFKDTGKIVANNCTITINSDPDGSGKIFDWVGTGKVRLGPKAKEHNLTHWAGLTAPADAHDAIAQVLSSIAAIGGGIMYAPANDWVTSGNVIPEGLQIRADGPERTRFLPSADGVSVFSHGDSVRYVVIKDCAIYGNNKNATGYTYDRIAPNLGGFIKFENVHVKGFTGASGVGLNLAPTDSGGQLQNCTMDRMCVVSDNKRNFYIDTSNTEIEIAAEVGVGAGQLGAWIERCGKLTFCNEWSGDATYGHNQVVYGMVAVDSGGVTAGIASVTVTALNMPNSPKTVPVPIDAMAVGGSITRAMVAAYVGQCVRDALGNDKDVSAFFHIAGVGPKYQMRRLDPVANDSTMAQVLSTGTAGGISSTSVSVTDAVVVSTTADGVTGNYASVVTSASGNFFDDLYWGWTATLSNGGGYTAKIASMTDAHTLVIYGAGPATLGSGVSMTIAPIVAGAVPGPGGGVDGAKGIHISNNAHGSIVFRDVQAEGFQEMVRSLANDLTSPLTFDSCSIQDAVHMDGAAGVKFTGGGRVQDKIVRGSSLAVSSCINSDDIDIDTYVNDGGGPSLFINRNTKRLTNFTNTVDATAPTSTITGATNATPIVVTTSAAHGLSTGSIAWIRGVLGNLAANIEFPTITVIDSTHFSINGSVGSGAYTSGGVVAGGYGNGIAVYGLELFDVSRDRTQISTHLPMKIFQTWLYTSLSKQPWFTLLTDNAGGLNPNQPQMRIGHCDSNGKEDFWFDIFRSLDPAHLGRLCFEGNQAGVAGYDFNGDIRGNGLTSKFIFGKVGYSDGAGQPATQPTNKHTDFTTHGVNLQIVLAASALAAGATETFTLTNNLISATDMFTITPAYSASVADPTVYEIKCHSPRNVAGVGTCKFSIKNLSGGSLSEPVAFNWAIIGGDS